MEKLLRYCCCLWCWWTSSTTRLKWKVLFSPFLVFSKWKWYQYIRNDTKWAKSSSLFLHFCIHFRKCSVQDLDIWQWGHAQLFLFFSFLFLLSISKSYYRHFHSKQHITNLFWCLLDKMLNIYKIQSCWLMSGGCFFNFASRFYLMWLLIFFFDNMWRMNEI